MTIASTHPKIWLQVTDLCAGFGDKTVLAQISLQITSGSVLGLLGPNGSGKSTLIRCLCGLQPPHAGQVLLAGIDLEHQPMLAKRALGFAPDVSALPAHLTARQCLQLVLAARMQPTQDYETGTKQPALPNRFRSAWDWLQARADAELPNDLLDYAERLRFTRFLDGFVAQFSLGTKQKLAILMALTDHNQTASGVTQNSPGLLILDEVFNGLDPLSAYALKAILREHAEGGGAVLLATHGLDLAQDLLTELIILGDGSIKAHFNPEHYAALRTCGDSTAVEQAIIAAMLD